MGGESALPPMSLRVPRTSTPAARLPLPAMASATAPTRSQDARTGQAAEGARNRLTMSPGPTRASRVGPHPWLASLGEASLFFCGMLPRSPRGSKVRGRGCCVRKEMTMTYTVEIGAAPIHAEPLLADIEDL